MKDGSGRDLDRLESVNKGLEAALNAQQRESSCCSKNWAVQSRAERRARHQGWCREH